MRNLLNSHLNSPLRKFIQSLLIILILTTQTSNYPLTYINSLPNQNQILTLKTYINATTIPVYKNKIKQTIIQNEPYGQLKQIIGLNISYSKQVGFVSQWSVQKLAKQQLNSLLGKNKSINLQQKSPIDCRLSNPQILFHNKSSFAFQPQHTNHSPKIITSYQQILNQQMILDVWKQTKSQKYSQSQNQNKIESDMSNIILIMMNDGDLLIVKSIKNGLNQNDQNKQGYSIKKVKLFDQMIKDGQFNQQRFNQQKKLYFFSSEFSVEIVFKESITQFQKKDPNTYKVTNAAQQNQDKSEQIAFNRLKIEYQNQSQPALEFKWITGLQNPKLAVMTRRQLQFYQYQTSTRSYKYIPSSAIGFSQMSNFFRMDEFQKSLTQPTFFLSSVIYYHKSNTIFLRDNGIGLLYLKWQQISKKFIITSYLNLMNALCNNVKLVSVEEKDQGSEQIIFFMNCQNNLAKAISTSTKQKGFKTKITKFSEFTIPSGQIIISQSQQENLIFFKGQTGISAYKSFNYPQKLTQQNMKVDNFFIFGKQFVSISDDMVFIGQYNIINQNIGCSYKQDQQKATISENHAGAESPLQMYVEYLSECNKQVLTNSPYQLSYDQFAKYSFCRYKKIYTSIKLQDASINKESINVYLILVLVAAGVLLLGTLAFWIWQRKKIVKILQEEGLPVGSQDLQSEEVVDKYFKQN